MIVNPPNFHKYNMCYATDILVYFNLHAVIFLCMAGGI